MQKEEAIKQNYHLAWHTAAFVGGLFAGKLPDLNKILSTPLVKSSPKKVDDELEESKVAALFDSMKYKLKDDKGNSLIQSSKLN